MTSKNDATYVCDVIDRNIVRKSKRMHYISNGYVIMFDYSDDVCIVKYKTDIVPLFVFNDEDSISRIRKKLLEAK